MFIAVTGASGHLGNNVVRVLLQNHHQVRAVVHHNTRGIENLPVEIVRADVLNPESLRSAFTGVDVVIHLAARISLVTHDRQKVEDTNVVGVRNMTDACLSVGVKRVVHVSSIHAHKGEPLNQELNETRSLVEYPNADIYDCSKARGELIVQQAISNGLNAVIVNPTGIIGPYDFEPSHFGAALLAFANGSIPVRIDGGFDWVDARDVATGILQAAESAPPGEKYLLSGHWVSITDLAGEVCRFMETKPPSLKIPHWGAVCVAPFAATYDRLAKRRSLFTPASMRVLNSNRHISHTKASRAFGYHPRLFQETICDTLTWFQANGFLNAGKELRADG